MKASEMFEVCHSRYRSLRAHLGQGTGELASIGLDKPTNGYSWRPDRARACEYVADCERIGRHGLRRAEWKGRLRLFEIYFLQGAEYRRAISLVGVAEGTFDYWFQEVKRTLGAEYSRTGLFPPSRYFQMRREEFLRRAAEKSDGSHEFEDGMLGASKPASLQRLAARTEAELSPIG